MLNTISNENLRKLIKQQIENRYNFAPHIGLKINLYRDYEVFALAEAVEQLMREKIITRFPIESIMVGDSYFTTHLGKNSTQLLTKSEQQDGLNIMVALIKEVREAIDFCFPYEPKPYLIGDMPDGTLESFEIALASVSRMFDAGADIVKIEITSDFSLEVIKKLCDMGLNIMAHVGYTPQKGKVRRYGSSISEALSLFSLVRQLRDYGVLAIVLEMVEETINQCLCKNNRELQICSIFSGKAKYGAQSLNVWDSFFKTEFENKYFPPTAQYNRSEYPTIYTKDAIKVKIYELMKMTLIGDFPKSPPTNLTEEERHTLNEINPWVNEKKLAENFAD